MTRLSPPSPAGKEWLTIPAIVKYTMPFWVCDRKLRADRPAGGRGEPGGLEEARAVLERVERGVAVAGDDVEAAERRVGARVDRSDAFESAPATVSDRKRSGVASRDARAACDRRRDLVVLGDRAGHQHVTREEVGDPAVARRERPGAQRADPDRGRHGDGEPRGGHRSPVPGTDQMSGTRVARR